MDPGPLANIPDAIQKWFPKPWILAWACVLAFPLWARLTPPRLARFGLEDLGYHRWLLLAFVFSTALLVSGGGAWLLKRSVASVRAYLRHRQLVLQVTELPDAEKALLRVFGEQTRPSSTCHLETSACGRYAGSGW